MSDTLPTTNTAISVADKINNIIFEVVVGSVETYAKAQLPFLNWPVISQLFDYCVQKLASLIQVQLENFVAFSIINIQVESENAAYQQAIMDLQTAYHNGDSNAITQAEGNFRTTLSGLVHWDGT